MKGKEDSGRSRRLQLQNDIVLFSNKLEFIRQQVDDLLSSNQIHGQSIDFFGANPRISRVREREKALFSKWTTLQQYRSHYYIEQQLDIELQVQKRERLNQLQQKIIELRKIKQEKQYHISSYQVLKSYNVTDSDIPYDVNELFSLHRETIYLQEQTAKQQAVLNFLQKKVQQIVLLLSRNPPLKEVLDFLGQKMTTQTKFVSPQHLTNATVIEEVMQSRSGHLQQQLRTSKVRLNEKIKKLQLSRTKIGLNCLIAKRGQLYFQVLHKEQATRLQAIQKRNHLLIQSISACNIEASLYQSLARRGMQLLPRRAVSESGQNRLLSQYGKQLYTVKKVQETIRCIEREVSRATALLEEGLKFKRSRRSLSSCVGSTGVEVVKEKREQVAHFLDQFSEIKVDTKRQIKRRPDASLLIVDQLTSQT